MINHNLKQRMLHELKVYWVYVAFFSLFFCAFTWYRLLILDEYAHGYVRFSYNVFQAMILSKIIMLGQAFGLGNERFADKPLIVPTLYRTVLFTFLVLVMTVLEHFLIGYFHGKSFATVTQTLLESGIYEILSRLLVMFFVFVLFFAFLEIDKVVGEEKLIDLFFKKRKLPPR